ncbi:phosphoribosylformylglycinamidine synthase, partial [Numida meleagris]|uniref:phosphoribosylformylglycinamidine synthase n=1 Tax=Numida meleagris TaxID=8996 RepID=UPI000B3D9C16
MAMAGNCGLSIQLHSDGAQPLALLFAEEPGLLLETPWGSAAAIAQRYRQRGVTCHPIGHSGPIGPHSQVVVWVDGTEVLREAVGAVRALWEQTSFQLERLQCARRCVEQEEAALPHRQGAQFSLSFPLTAAPALPPHVGAVGPRVAVLREEGSNGDREMAAAFHMAGFQVWDVTTEDLCSGTATLDGFRGVVFVGGFSYADVLGSAKGWAAVARFDPRVRAALEGFRRRPDTFSLGVCNGCQLLALLGWVGDPPGGTDDAGAGAPPPVLLTPNVSGRFESRFVAVRVEPGPAIMLRGMQGSVLGVWVAHGQGRFQFRRPEALSSALGGGLAPLLYVDDVGRPTEEYPMNPNGSGGGVAALCSPCGRHL